MCSSGQAHAALNAMQNQNKSSRKQTIAIKGVSESGKKDDQMDFREPDQLPVLPLTPSTFQYSGLERGSMEGEGFMNAVNHAVIGLAACGSERHSRHEDV